MTCIMHSNVIRLKHILIEKDPYVPNFIVQIQKSIYVPRLLLFPKGLNIKFLAQCAFEI